jgi:hypothetical protein
MGPHFSGSLEKFCFLSAFVSNIFCLFSCSLCNLHCQFRTTRSRVLKIYLFIGPRNICLFTFPETLEHFFIVLQKHRILRRFTLQLTAYNIMVCRNSASLRCQHTVQFSKWLFWQTQAILVYRVFSQYREYATIETKGTGFGSRKGRMCSLSRCPQAGSGPHIFSYLTWHSGILNRREIVRDTTSVPSNSLVKN